MWAHAPGNLGRPLRCAAAVASLAMGMGANAAISGSGNLLAAGGAPAREIVAAGGTSARHLSGEPEPGSRALMREVVAKLEEEARTREQYAFLRFLERRDLSADGQEVTTRYSEYRHRSELERAAIQ